mmetsp:Transcript_31214/g.38541  ORF Transcript_31214/g.38541 Transcript_31214/m.38541 type:complete len:103 (-) Transcript_31214:2339-2647(-)
MAQMAEAAMMGGGGAGGETFLTDMLMTGSQRRNTGVGAKKSGKATFQTAAKPNLRSGSRSRMTPSKEQHATGADVDQSEQLSDLESEYRDVVNDVAFSRAMV